MAVEPTHKSLELQNERRKKGGFFGRFLHPNPYFYKYYWWVFHSDSPIEGWAFITEEYRICSADAKQLTDELEAANKPYWIYNDRLPRLDPVHTPFDRYSAKWIDDEWAPSFDADSDRPVQWGTLLIK